MGLRLFLYLGILALGGTFGYFDKVSEKISSKLNLIQNVILLFLLFIMGITIGINEEVISNMFSIGLKALILAITTLIFTIGFVRLISKYVKQEDNNHGI